MESNSNHNLSATPLSPTSGKPPRKNGAIWVISGVIALVVLFGLGLAPKLQADGKLDKDAKESASAAQTVDVASPRVAPPDALLLPASVQAIESTPIQARTTGYVRKLYVDIGSKVKAGQVLAEIEAPDADQQLAQSIADTAKSRATVGQSEAIVASSKATVASSQADLARQSAAIKQAKAALAGSDAKLAEAKALQSQAEATVANRRQVVNVQRANLQLARAQYDLAATTVKRYQNLLKEGYVAQQDYDQAVATYKSAGATVTASEANVNAAVSDVNSSQQALIAAVQAVKAAQTDVDSSRENVTASYATYKSLQATIDANQAGVIANKAVTTANKAAVISSVANQRRYEVLHAFQTVVAPFDGVITARNVDIGSLVSPGNIVTGTAATATTSTIGLFSIARTDTLRVFINVPQTDFQSITVGTKAQIIIRELPGAKITGSVYQSAGAIDSTSRTLLTEIRLPNEKGQILPGMYAQVLLASDTLKPVIRIPANTLLIDGEGNHVFTVDQNNIAHSVKVTLGQDFGTEIAITAGVQPGDKLIANPTFAIKEGTKVSINPPTPAPKDSNAPPASTPPGAAQPGASPTQKKGQSS